MSYWAIAKVVGSLLLIGGVLLFARSCGYDSGVASMQKKVDALEQLVTSKNRSLSAAARSFEAFAKTFRAIDAIADQQIEEAKTRALAAENAGRTAQAAEQAAQARAAAHAQQLVEAKRKPDCKALLEANLEAVCGLQLR